MPRMAKKMKLQPRCVRRAFVLNNGYTERILVVEVLLGARVILNEDGLAGWVSAINSS